MTARAVGRIRRAADILLGMLKAPLDPGRLRRSRAAIDGEAEWGKGAVCERHGGRVVMRGLNEVSESYCCQV